MGAVREKGDHDRKGNWTVLAVWVTVIGALALLGTGLAERLAPTSLAVPGSPSARAHEAIEREFGNSVPVTVLIEGPGDEIDRQGPRLLDALRAEPDVHVMSPWDQAGNELNSLRPGRDAALIVANFERDESVAMSEVVPTAQRIVEERIGAPLQAHVGGVAAIAVALQENALEATHDAELLVAPILVIVLLLVFRSPVAALLPLLIGGATVQAGHGLLLLLSHLMPVNALAVAIASMMGLALGVDYSLLMVSRFRQEREGGADGEAAIAIAARAAGQTVLFAGATLALVMVAAALVAPGDLLSSVAAGVVVSTVLSVALAISLMPALLRIFLPYLERWRLPTLRRGGAGLVGVAQRLIARPWLAIPLVAVPMLVIAGPAGALSIGPPDPRQLPPSDPTRQGFEALSKAIGPGWTAPFAVIATARSGSISDSDRLEAMSKWQERIARDPDVAAVIGPASLAEAAKPVEKLRDAYREAPEELADAKRGVDSLRDGLRQAGEGVAQLRAGLGAGADGAGTIAERTREAEEGAGRLHEGLGRAGAGAGRLTRGIGKAEGGAGRLLRGQRRLSRGAGRLGAGLNTLDRELQSSMVELRELSARIDSWSTWLRQIQVPATMAAAQLDLILQQIDSMTVGRDDPRYAELADAVRQAAALIGAQSPQDPSRRAADERALPAGVSQSVVGAVTDVTDQIQRELDSLASLPGRVEQLADGVRQLRDGGSAVAAGARAAAGGSRAMRDGLRKLEGGSRRLSDGLAKAYEGSGRLPEGLRRLAAGADELAGGLQEGQERSGELEAGLAKPEGPLSRYALMLRGFEDQYRSLDARSPGAIDSGFLMLAALDGTVPGVREQIAQVANLDGGGRSARMLIIPRTGPSAAPTQRLGKRLEEGVPKLARSADADVEVGEGAQVLTDYSNATLERIPWLILALCLVSVVMLTMVLRSLLLPLIAVALNLLTVAAAFGALQIFFHFDLLVGPPYIDAISAAGVMTIMFVLSIDYEVFLLSRMREIWLQTRDHELAVERGLRGTAGVITGAAVIMGSVFLVFATADIASLQQFGAGLTFAVLLDATIVRLVLLPAVMRVLGPRAWWLPGWLDRHLPEIEHGEPGPPASASYDARSWPPSAPSSP